MIDIHNPDASCLSLPDLPYLDAVGGLIRGKIPLVCGGYYDGANAETDLCTILDPQSGKWIQAGKMSGPKKRAASIQWDFDTVMIAGGTDGPDSDLSAAELITITDEEETRFALTTRPAPSLPANVSWHCLAKINATTAFMIGGWPGIGSTYFLDLKTDLD